MVYAAAMTTCADGHPVYEVYVDLRKLIGFCMETNAVGGDDCFGHEKPFPVTWHKRGRSKVTRL